MPGPGEESAVMDAKSGEYAPAVDGSHLPWRHRSGRCRQNFPVNEHKIVHPPFILEGVIEIVGGGVIGLSCAWELGRRGMEAVVYEREMTRRKSASWAGAGMLGALAETFPDELWRSRAMESARMYGDFVKAIGGEIDFVEGGEDFDGHVDPRDLLRELERQVKVVSRDVRAWEDLQGEQVIVASGAWWMEKMGLPRVEPVKGYILAWDGLPPGSVKGILREGHTYLLQRRGGRVIVGSTEERIGFDEEKDSLRIEELRQRAVRLWPALEGRPVTEVWFGFRPAAQGDVPLVQRWNAKVVLAYGHYRNGILLAPWTAHWVADEIQRQLGK